MRFLARCIAVSFVLAAWLVPAQAQLNWQRLGGPEEVEVREILEQGGALYAGTLSGGVFRSSNGGANWAPVNTGLPSLSITGLVATPDGLGLLTAVHSVIYKSTNGGTSWTRSDTGLRNSTVQTLRLVRAGAAVYATGFDLGIRRSIDNGTSWSTMNGGFTAGTNGSLNIDVIDFASDNLGNTAVGVKTTFGSPLNAPGVYVSNGGNWERKVNGLPDDTRIIATPVHNPADPASLYVFVSEAASGNGLYKSTNGGEQWTSVSTFVTDFDRLMFSPDGADLFFIRAPNNGATLVRRNLVGNVSTDFSTRFENITSAYRAFSMFFPSDGRFLVGTVTGIHRADADFSVLRRFATGLSGGELDSVTVSPDGLSLLTTTGDDRVGGVSRSLDGGNTWQIVGPKNPQGKFIGFGNIFRTHTGTYLLDGSYRSTDLGETWATLAGDKKAGLKLVQGPDGTIYSTRESFSNSARISTDDGLTFSNLTPNISPSFMAVGPDNSLYYTGGLTVDFRKLQRLRKGASTVETLFSEGELVDLEDLASGPGACTRGAITGTPLVTADGVIYVTLDELGSCRTTGVFRSVDDGKTFVPVNNGLVEGTRFTAKLKFLASEKSLHAGSDGRLYLASRAQPFFDTGGGSGVFVSDNCGDSWQAMPDGLPPLGAPSAAADANGNPVLLPADDIKQTNVIATSSNNIFVATIVGATDGGAGLYQATLPAPKTTACTFVKADPFSFTDQPAAPLNTLVTSNEISLSGFSGQVKAGALGGEYSLNGGAFITTPSMVQAGDKLRVRHTTANAINQSRTTQMIVGNISDRFTTTTADGDISPDDFSFPPVVVPCNTRVESAEVTITGITAASPVRLFGNAFADYRINGGTYTTQEGAVNNNDKVQMRAFSLGEPDRARSPRLQIGDKEASWEVKTAMTCEGGGDPDPDPDPDQEDRLNQFVFIDQPNVANGAALISNAVKIEVIAEPVRIRVENGEYSINGGTFTSDAGMVPPDALVRVRHTSASSGGLSVNTVLYVGFPENPDPNKPEDLGVFDTFTSTTKAPDDVNPTPFSFTDMEGVATGSVQTSNTITLAGLGNGKTVPVSVSGGSYSVNGGAFVTAVGATKNGDTLAVRHTAASANSTAVNTTLTVGGYSDTYTSVTAASPIPPLPGPAAQPDTTPQPFRFNDVQSVMRSTVTESNTVTLTGLSGNATLSVSGGEYKIGNGSYTSAAGTVANNAMVTVRHTSAAAYDGATSTTLTVGGVSDTFTSVTEKAPAAASNRQVVLGDDGGAVEITHNKGSVMNLRTVPAPSAAPTQFDYPAGFFAFDIAGIPDGETVTVVMELPASQRPVSYVKCTNDTSCTSYPGAVINDNVVTLSLTDGGMGDADGMRNGRIQDPGAPAFTPVPPSSGGGAGTGSGGASNGTGASGSRSGGAFFAAPLLLLMGLLRRRALLGLGLFVALGLSACDRGDDTTAPAAARCALGNCGGGSFASLAIGPAGLQSKDAVVAQLANLPAVAALAEMGQGSFGGASSAAAAKSARAKTLEDGECDSGSETDGSESAQDVDSPYTTSLFDLDVTTIDNCRMNFEFEDEEEGIRVEGFVLSNGRSASGQVNDTNGRVDYAEVSDGAGAPFDYRFNARVTTAQGSGEAEARFGFFFRLDQREQNGVREDQLLVNLQGSSGQAGASAGFRVFLGEEGMPFGRYSEPEGDTRSLLIGGDYGFIVSPEPQGGPCRFGRTNVRTRERLLGSFGNFTDGVLEFTSGSESARVEFHDDGTMTVTPAVGAPERVEQTEVTQYSGCSAIALVAFGFIGAGAP